MVRKNWTIMKLDLRFMPVWIDLEKAIEINNFLLNSSDPPRWLEEKSLDWNNIRDLIAEALIRLKMLTTHLIYI